MQVYDFPAAVASSAYHVWITAESWFTFSMRGCKAMAYIGMVRGPPCVVPSWEYSVDPSTKSFVSLRYMLMRAVAMEGQRAQRSLRLTDGSKSWKHYLCQPEELLHTFHFWMPHSWHAGASVPDFWPAQSCSEPAVFWMSPFVTDSIALAMILLTTSHTPMGRTPGFLSSAIKQQDNNGARPSGSTNVLQSHLVSNTREWHRSSEADLKEQQNLLHPLASMPERSAGSLVWKAAERMVFPCMLSNNWMNHRWSMCSIHNAIHWRWGARRMFGLQDLKDWCTCAVAEGLLWYCPATFP